MVLHSSFQNQPTRFRFAFMASELTSIISLPGCKRETDSRLYDFSSFPGAEDVAKAVRRAIDDVKKNQK